MADFPAVAELRASRWPPTVVVPVHADDDPAAALAWVETLEAEARDARTETVVLVIQKLSPRPAGEPAPWSAAASVSVECVPLPVAAPRFCRVTSLEEAVR
jgi:hypothetical protein